MEIQNDQNRVNSIILAIFLTEPVVIDVLNVLVQQYGLGSTSIYTLIIHLIIMVYMVANVKLYKNDIGILLLIYIVFILNFILFSDTRSYMLSDNMIFVYLFALPCAVISIRKITDWNQFLAVYRIFPIIATIVGTFMMLALNYNSYLIYMDFSYAMLPSVCANYYFAKKDITDAQNGKRFLFLIAFIISFVEIVIFGARATIFFALIYIVVFEIMRSDKKIGYKFAIGSFFGIISLILFKYLDYIMNFLYSFGIFQGSRFFTKFETGKLLYSKGRDDLQILCQNRIKSMGLEISGFFGDRAYCGDNPYPHNIFRELLMSWGWIIGILLIALLIILIIGALARKNEARDVALLLTISIFARYLVSGSYIQESKFYIFVFAMIAILASTDSILPIKIVVGKTKIF